MSDQLSPPFSPWPQMLSQIPEPSNANQIPLQKKLSHDELPSTIATVLPKGYSYIFKAYEPLTSENHNAPFLGTFFTNVKSEPEAVMWIQQFEAHTETTYRITRGVKVKGERILYKTIRHCQHKHKNSKVQPSKRHTTNITKRDKKQSAQPDSP